MCLVSLLVVDTAFMFFHDSMERSRHDPREIAVYRIVQFNYRFLLSIVGLLLNVYSKCIINFDHLTGDSTIPIRSELKRLRISTGGRDMNCVLSIANVSDEGTCCTYIPCVPAKVQLGPRGQSHLYGKERMWYVYMYQHSACKNTMTGLA